MSEQNLGPYFIPRRGLSGNLIKEKMRDGQFFITLDDRKIYADVIINGSIERIPLGGDINTQYISWELIKEKPFDSLSSDFKVVAENINDESINKIFLADSLKITNKTILDKFSENENGLLYDNQPVGAKGTFIYTGRVDSFYDLQQIENPIEGQVYNVGVSTAQSFDKYVYIVNPQTEDGAWEIFYSKPNYATLPNKPQINGVTLEGNKSLSDLGIVSGGQIVDEPTAAEISTSIANIWG